jgi:hypothetical protein
MATLMDTNHKSNNLAAFFQSTASLSFILWPKHAESSVFSRAYRIGLMGLEDWPGPQLHLSLIAQDGGMLVSSISWIYGLKSFLKARRSAIWIQKYPYYNNLWFKAYKK